MYNQFVRVYEYEIKFFSYLCIYLYNICKVNNPYLDQDKDSVLNMYCSALMKFEKCDSIKMFKMEVNCYVQEQYCL